MPPFSPLVVPGTQAGGQATKGFLPNSMKLFWPEKPCQPSVPTQGGSTRPVESPVVPLTLSPAGQSADAQYLAPGTRRVVGTEICSAVFARFPAMLEFPHTVPVVPPHVEPSDGPPAS